ncbi:MAG TPA: LLM class flavin-dependent oxidoreductase [Solirubrobacteraceae bacterium]|jgi:alkanesulfonate monooxygenase SsuD/methylene tetrahydromethanopterin reductase-like flavin-dependent oxidoreductase (luciferase family)
MQSTVSGPGNFARLYREFAEDVELVERHGFASVWSAEHRIWYDGCCPSLLHAQAAAVSRTKHVRFNHAMLLAPQHDPIALARSALTFDRLSGGRLDLGLALGHRDAEFDALGLRRDRRARLMERTLDVLSDAWAGAFGDSQPVQAGGIPVWIGGMAPAVIARAARYGHGLVLPPTLSPARTRAAVDAYSEQATGPVTAEMGMLRDVFVTDVARDAEVFRERLRIHYREEIGSWWPLKGGVGFQAGEEVDRQTGFNDRGAIVGPPEDVARAIADLFDAGITHLALRLKYDFVERAATHEQIARVAEEVAPLLTPTGAIA